MPGAPAGTLVAKPVLVTVTTDGEAELHEARLVTPNVLASLRVAVAVICCVGAPGVRIGVSGVTAMDTTATALMFTGVKVYAEPSLVYVPVNVVTPFPT